MTSFMRAPISKYSSEMLYSLVGLPLKKTYERAREVVLDGDVYPSISAASRAIGCHDSSMIYALKKGVACKGHVVSYFKGDS